jgi:hypothetical protein
LTTTQVEHLKTSTNRLYRRGTKYKKRN